MNEPRGLTLTPAFRARMEAGVRVRLQPPTDPGQIRVFDRRIAGLPGDVLFTLENLRYLADQGNRVSALLWEAECKRLGIWYERGVWAKP